MSGHRARRLTRPTSLRGSNGVAFGPDGRLYVAQFLAGRISAVDLTSGDVEVVVPEDGPVQAPDDLAFGPDGSMYVTDLVPAGCGDPAPTAYGDATGHVFAISAGVALLGVLAAVLLEPGPLRTSLDVPGSAEKR